MDSIKLINAVPEIFAMREDLRSDIWHSNVEFERGKKYLIRAESGTGKSSMCSYLYGSRGDYRGDILFDDKDVRDFSTRDWCHIRQRQISILFQDLRIFGELTAMENVLIKNRMYNTQSNQTILGWFEQLGIPDKVNSRMDRMSYGQQQRVALIRALCQPFSFILLDEPISHLDDRNSDIMRDIVLAEAERQGATIIATSIGKHMNIDYDKIYDL